MNPDSNTKRTKRLRDDDDSITLEEHIARRRKMFVTAREEIPKLYKQTADKKKEATVLTKRFQTRQKLDLLEEAEELLQEAKIRASMIREHEFEQNVVTYLKTYQMRVSVKEIKQTKRKSDSIQAFVKQSDMNQHRKSVVLDEYLMDMNQAPPKVAMATRDDCPRCDQKLLLCASKSIMTCPECGYCVTYLDATSSSTSFDEIVEYSQYSYKRVNHYLMWLSLVQGKEAHRVPDAVMQAVMNDLYHRQGITQSKDVTQKRVRDTLRALRLRKAYDHVAQITSRLSGQKPPRITPETEEQLKNMFLQMQPAFQRHAPKTRTNFLSYSYVLYRSFQILGLTHMLDGLQLLKGRDKLEANDSIFRKMCEDLGWPVFDLPIR